MATLAVAPVTTLVALATAFAAPAAAQTTLAERTDALIRSYHDLGRFNGAALVVYDGAPLVEDAYGFARLDGDAATNGAGAGETPARVGTRFRIASLSGSFTAALVLRLWERGTLDLEAPVREYIPEYPAPQGDRVTIHHLLTHTSGIPRDTDRPAFMEERAEEPLSPAAIVALAWEEPLRFEPGSRFEYDDTGYLLLGWIAERVTGRPYDALLRELVLDPVGLDDTGYDRERRPGAGHALGYTRSLAGVEPARVIDPTPPFPAGMLYSTAGDLGRWAAALARFRPGRPFEDPATLERMLTPSLEGYAYGIGVSERSIGREDSVRVLQSTGGIPGFSSALRVFPDHDRAIVLLDNTSSDLRPLLEGLTNTLWGAEAPPPKPSIAGRLLPIIETAGAEAALDRYRSWRRTRPDQYDYGPDELVRLARHLLGGEHDPGPALAVLETALELHPDASGASLALHELHLAAGDTGRAVAALEAALTWRPGAPRLLEPLLALGVEPPVMLRIPVAEVPSRALDRVVGAYRIDPATTLDIRREGEGLVAQRTGEAAFTLLPQSETTYLLEGSAIQLSFRIEGGRATSVDIVESGRRVTFPRAPSPR